MRTYLNRYIVSYDITADERRTALFETLKGAGDHIQYSVFSCELNEISLAKLQARVAEIINHDVDQVLFMDLGPINGRGGSCVTSIGKPYGGKSRRAFVI